MKYIVSLLPCIVSRVTFSHLPLFFASFTFLSSQSLLCAHIILPLPCSVCACKWMYDTTDTRFFFSVVSRKVLSWYWNWRCACAWVYDIVSLCITAAEKKLWKSIQTQIEAISVPYFFVCLLWGKTTNICAIKMHIYAQTLRCQCQQQHLTGKWGIVEIETCWNESHHLL